MLKHTPRNAEAVRHFNGDQEESPNLSRVTRWVDGAIFFSFIYHLIHSATTAAFATYAPLLHQYYKNVTNALYDAPGPSLTPNRTDTVFPAMSVNFGPNVVCDLHRDSGNLANGYCWLLAGGEFDATLGGHLYLEELNLAIEFPAGSSIFFPSAVIAHANVPIDRENGEVRWSITQYAAGGLFRWVEYGHHTWKALEKFHSTIASKITEDLEQIWEQGLKLFSTFNSLKQDREEVQQLYDPAVKEFKAAFKASDYKGKAKAY